jgi:hypothetical protein
VTKTEKAIIKAAYAWYRRYPYDHPRVCRELFEAVWHDVESKGTVRAEKGEKK